MGVWTIACSLPLGVARSSGSRGLSRYVRTRLIKYNCSPWGNQMPRAKKLKAQSRSSPCFNLPAIQDQKRIVSAPAVD